MVFYSQFAQAEAEGGRIHSQNHGSGADLSGLNRISPKYFTALNGLKTKLVLDALGLL